MFKKLALALALTLASATVALAANYIEPQELKELLDQKKPVILVDIQPAADFEKHHLPGSIETNAFPAKTDVEKARLDQALAVIKASKAPVVVICPRGKSGAKNSYNYLQSKGVSEDRMTILEGGIFEWPYQALFVKGR
ncbi:rhodanese-like domain-containing protein [Geomesophilobacter sediminis]|uniref:Rhodanese-like domain-containing protein n=1 Tax=Geomesophilobacter sediminis TaxID=2798584 RepID=A0A8J7S8Z1_9BACT|nr:rhodanese-like domain-containing protein [Geomesophilobacter sediminis]MBJ6727961.1 rhodanese-like domain-containing protein [Geomesophilobacter sediminis]